MWNFVQNQLNFVEHPSAEQPTHITIEVAKTCALHCERSDVAADVRRNRIRRVLSMLESAIHSLSRLSDVVERAFDELATTFAHAVVNSAQKLDCIVCGTIEFPADVYETTANK